MNALRQDIRHSLRVLRHNPTFALAAILTLGLVVAANADSLPAVNTGLVNPLPFKVPDKLLFVMENDQRASGMLGVSSGTFLEWKTAESPFSDAAAWRFEYFNLTGRDEPEQVVGLR